MVGSEDGLLRVAGAFYCVSFWDIDCAGHVYPWVGILRAMSSDGENKLKPPWEKGVSGNPGGRPKGLKGIRKMIAQQGDKLVEQILLIATGEATETRVTKDGEPFDVAPRLADQIKAIEVCLSYWVGKPQQQVKIDMGGNAAEMMRATLEQLRTNPTAAPAMLTLAEVSSTTLPKKAD